MDQDETVEGEWNLKEPRRRGRPRIVGTKAAVHLRLPAREFDVLSACAKQQGISVPRLIRQLVLIDLKP